MLCVVVEGSWLSVLLFVLYCLCSVCLLVFGVVCCSLFVACLLLAVACCLLFVVAVN